MTWTFFLSLILDAKMNSFQPFADHQSTSRDPWPPFSDHNDGNYEKTKATYENYFGPDIKGKALEDAAITTLKTLVFASKNRTTLFIQPSGVGKGNGDGS